MALFALGWGCSSPAPPPATTPPATTPPVVALAEPAAATEPVQPIDDPPKAAAEEQAPARGSCPFPAPAEEADDYAGPMPAAPVLGSEEPAPRDVPPQARTAIARALDPRLSQRRTTPRLHLATTARLLQRLLRATSKSAPDRPDLIRRLAEAQVELANAAQQAQDGPAEKAHRREAIRHYDWFKTSYPGDKALDQVLYHAALEHQRLGDLSATRKAYLELISGVPHSKLLPRAYVAFGEIFFEEARSDPTKLKLAQEFYQQALNYPPRDNPVYGLAQYRLGHVHWRMANPTQALEAFVKTLQYVGSFPKAPEVKVLGPAAMDAAVHTYAEIGRPDRACPFLHRLAATPSSPAATLRALTSLGEAYLRTGRRAEALVIYQILERHHRGPERRRDRTVLSLLRAK